jgi:hypothetical protein
MTILQKNSTSLVTCPVLQGILLSSFLLLHLLFFLFLHKKFFTDNSMDIHIVGLNTNFMMVKELV